MLHKSHMPVQAASQPHYSVRGMCCIRRIASSSGALQLGV